MKLPRFIEDLLDRLLPPDFREEIIGDLHERCTSTLQTIAEVVKLVPAILW